MFKKESSSNEIASNMEKNFLLSFYNEDNKQDHKRLEALSYLNKAAEALEKTQLLKEADNITKLIEIIATKKKIDKPTHKLTSEQAVKNIKERGWMFNAAEDDDISVWLEEEGEPESKESPQIAQEEKRQFEEEKGGDLEKAEEAYLEALLGEKPGKLEEEFSAEDEDFEET